MRHWSLLLVVLLPAFAHAQEQPEWKELQQLFGRKITDKEVVEFVAKYELKKTAKADSGTFIAPHRGYSLMFRGDTVATVILRVSRWPKGYGGEDWTIYAKPLPGGLSPDGGRRIVERKLGAPTRPGGDHWIHGEFTIWVLFSKPEPGIDELYVWRTKDEQ